MDPPESPRRAIFFTVDPFAEGSRLQELPDYWIQPIRTQVWFFFRNITLWSLVILLYFTLTVLVLTFYQPLSVLVRTVAELVFWGSSAIYGFQHALDLDKNRIYWFAVVFSWFLFSLFIVIHYKRPIYEVLESIYFWALVLQGVKFYAFRVYWDKDNGFGTGTVFGPATVEKRTSEENNGSGNASGNGSNGSRRTNGFFSSSSSENKPSGAPIPGYLATLFSPSMRKQRKGRLGLRNIFYEGFKAEGIPDSEAWTRANKLERDCWGVRQGYRDIVQTLKEQTGLSGSELEEIVGYPFGQAGAGATGAAGTEGGDNAGSAAAGSAAPEEGGAAAAAAVGSATGAAAVAATGGDASQSREGALGLKPKSLVKKLLEKERSVKILSGNDDGENEDEGDGLTMAGGLGVGAGVKTDDDNLEHSELPPPFEIEKTPEFYNIFHTAEGWAFQMRDIQEYMILLFAFRVCKLDILLRTKFGSMEMIPQDIFEESFTESLMVYVFIFFASKIIVEWCARPLSLYAKEKMIWNFPHKCVSAKLEFYSCRGKSCYNVGRGCGWNGDAAFDAGDDECVICLDSLRQKVSWVGRDDSIQFSMSRRNPRFRGSALRRRKIEHSGEIVGRLEVGLAESESMWGVADERMGLGGHEATSRGKLKRRSAGAKSKGISGKLGDWFGSAGASGREDANHEGSDGEMAGESDIAGEDVDLDAGAQGDESLPWDYYGGEQGKQRKQELFGGLEVMGGSSSSSAGVRRRNNNKLGGVIEEAGETNILCNEGAAATASTRAATPAVASPELQQTSNNQPNSNNQTRNQSLSFTMSFSDFRSWIRGKISGLCGCANRIRCVSRAPTTTNSSNSPVRGLNRSVSEQSRPPPVATLHDDSESEDEPNLSVNVGNNNPNSLREQPDLLSQEESSLLAPIWRLGPSQYQLDRLNLEGVFHFNNGIPENEGRFSLRALWNFFYYVVTGEFIASLASGWLDLRDEARRRRRGENVNGGNGVLNGVNREEFSRSRSGLESRPSPRLRSSSGPFRPEQPLSCPFTDNILHRPDQPYVMSITGAHTGEHCRIGYTDGDDFSDDDTGVEGDFEGDYLERLGLGGGMGGGGGQSSNMTAGGASADGNTKSDDPYGDDATLNVLLSCGHEFHMSCLANWIGSQKEDLNNSIMSLLGNTAVSATCPTCRNQLSWSPYKRHQIEALHNFCHLEALLLLLCFPTAWLIREAIVWGWWMMSWGVGMFYAVGRVFFVFGESSNVAANSVGGVGGVISETVGGNAVGISATTGGLVMRAGAEWASSTLAESALAGAKFMTDEEVEEQRKAISSSSSSSSSTLAESGEKKSLPSVEKTNNVNAVAEKSTTTSRITSNKSKKSKEKVYGVKFSGSGALQWFGSWFFSTAASVVDSSTNTATPNAGSVFSDSALTEIIKSAFGRIWSEGAGAVKKPQYPFWNGMGDSSGSGNGVSSSGTSSTSTGEQVQGGQMQVQAGQGQTELETSTGEQQQLISSNYDPSSPSSSSSFSNQIANPPSDEEALDGRDEWGQAVFVQKDVYESRASPSNGGGSGGGSGGIGSASDNLVLGFSAETFSTDPILATKRAGTVWGKMNVQAGFSQGQIVGVWTKVLGQKATSWLERLQKMLQRLDKEKLCELEGKTEGKPIGMAMPNEDLVKLMEGEYADAWNEFRRMVEEAENKTTGTNTDVTGKAGESGDVVGTIGNNMTEDGNLNKTSGQDSVSNSSFQDEEKNVTVTSDSSPSDDFSDAVEESSDDASDDAEDADESDDDLSFFGSISKAWANRPTMWKLFQSLGNVKAAHRSHAAIEREKEKKRLKAKKEERLKKKLKQLSESNSGTSNNAYNNGTNSGINSTVSLTAKLNKTARSLPPDLIGNEIPESEARKKDLDLTTLAALISRLLLAGYGGKVLETVFFTHEFDAKERANWRRRLNFVEHVAEYVRGESGFCPWREVEGAVKEAENVVALAAAFDANSTSTVKGNASDLIKNETGLNLSGMEQNIRDTINRLELAVVPLRNVVRETLLERIEAGNRLEAAEQSREGANMNQNGDGGQVVGKEI